MKSLKSHYLEPVGWYHLPFNSWFAMKPHMHPQFEIMYCEQGSFSVKCYNEERELLHTVQVVEKSFILLNNTCYHQLIIDTYDARILNIELMPVESLPKNASHLLKKAALSTQDIFSINPQLSDLKMKNDHYYVFNDAHEVGSTLWKLVHHLLEIDNPLTDLSVRLLISELFIDISYCWLIESYTPPLQTYIKKALLYIQHNFNKQLSVSSIANAIGITPQYLQRLFKSELGESVHTVITNIRIEKAKKLLRDTTFTIQNIAELSGLGTRANLISALKKYENCTPTDFRQSVLQKQWSVQMPSIDIVVLD